MTQDHDTTEAWHLDEDHAGNLYLHRSTRRAQGPAYDVTALADEGSALDDLDAAALGETDDWTAPLIRMLDCSGMTTIIAPGAYGEWLLVGRCGAAATAYTGIPDWTPLDSALRSRRFYRRSGATGEQASERYRIVVQYEEEGDREQAGERAMEDAMDRAYVGETQDREPGR